MTAAKPANAAPNVMPAKSSVGAPARKTARKTTARKVAVKPPPQAAVADKAAPGKVASKKTVAKKVVEAKEPPAKKLKQKLVRDSFTMPSNDFQLIEQLKQRALGFKRPAKKSELLRAGLHALASLGDTELRAALDALDPLKPGRPRKTPA